MDDVGAQWRVEFDAEVEFGNGGALQAQGFRLDIPGADMSEAEIGELFVRHLGLLMVSETTITNKRLLNEPHKGSRGVPTGVARRRAVVELSPPGGAPVAAGRHLDLPAVVARLLGGAATRIEPAALAAFDVAGAGLLLHTDGRAYLTEAAARWLAAQGVALVGTDTADAGPAGAVLAGSGIPVVTGLRDLDRLPPTGSWLLLVPYSPAGQAMRMYGISDGG